MNRYVLLVILLVGCSETQPVCYQAKVVKVGGCDRYGTCSVEIEGGKITVTYFPVEGYDSEVCTCNGVLNKAKYFHSYNRCY